MTAAEIYNEYRERKERRKATALYRLEQETMKEVIRENPKKYEFELMKLERMERKGEKAIIDFFTKAFEEDQNNAVKFLNSLTEFEVKYDFYLKDKYHSFIWEDNPTFYGKLQSLAEAAINR